MKRIFLSGLLLAMVGHPAVAYQEPIENLKAISDPIQRATGKKIQPREGENDLCYSNDNGQFCFVRAGSIDIDVWGRGIVKLAVSTKVAPSIYQRACAAAFEGLTGSDPDFAREIITEAFNHASVQGRFETEISQVQLKVVPAGDSDLLECSFFRF